MATLTATAEHLREHDPARLAQHLNDRITRAFTLDPDLRISALDFNARLVTELRTRNIWPARPSSRCPAEPDAA
jgi:hypothetical protein